MLNQFTLIGRMVEITKEENGAYGFMKLAVTRSIKNDEGMYDTDFIPIKLWCGIMENAFNFCQKGDMIGVRGRIETENNEVVIIAEKVTFLSSTFRGEE